MSATKKVLVVDDDKVSLDLMAAVLQQAEVSMIPVIISSQSMETLYQNSAQIGLALLDLSMPGLSGFEVCRLIRSDPRFAELPIVAVTANATQDTYQRALDTGFNKVITKPYHPQRIFDLLKEFHIT